MRRTDRLFRILRLLRGGGTVRAADIARRLKVSERTIYRDMDTLAASGIAVTGTRGSGYRMQMATTLPPLTLTATELEALNLGIAVVSEASDPELAAAARSLADKLDAAQPAAPPPPGPATLAIYPFASAARGLSHMGLLRGAIRGRQKLRLRCRDTDGSFSDHNVRPLAMEYWGRVWTLTAWDETAGRFNDFRLDLIEDATALPELFSDEPGKRLADRRPQS
jgi:predicted DNA-binding transcriptional regulator YafY